MKGLREKFRNKKGFTLIEMLIVVAIIAILVVVSVPLIGNSLDKAREAVDAANERSATGLATIYYLTSENATDDFDTGVTIAIFRIANTVSTPGGSGNKNKLSIYCQYF